MDTLTTKILQANQKSKNNTVYTENVLQQISDIPLDNHCISSDEYITLVNLEGRVKRFRAKLVNQIDEIVNR